MKKPVQAPCVWKEPLTWAPGTSFLGIGQATCIFPKGVRSFLYLAAASDHLRVLSTVSAKMFGTPLTVTKP